MQKPFEDATYALRVSSSFILRHISLASCPSVLVSMMTLGTAIAGEAGQLT